MRKVNKERVRVIDWDFVHRMILNMRGEMGMKKMMVMMGKVKKNGREKGNAIMSI